MDQLAFNFSSNSIPRVYSVEDNTIIENRIINYNSQRHVIENQRILHQLFFEEHCIEIVRRLKSRGYFLGEWHLVNKSFSWSFYNFINSSLILDDSSVFEFILTLLTQIELNIKVRDWQNNEINRFEFDRKITEYIIERICDWEVEKALIAFICYVKIWNHSVIYTSPFNNNKALLIHRIFSDKIWPKSQISYDMLSEFEKFSSEIITSAHNKSLYVPFFDIMDKDVYSNNYLLERKKLRQNIEKLFDYDVIDESESYQSLIDDLIKDSSNANSYKRDLIQNKVERGMFPSAIDIEKFVILYKNSNENKLGKWLLSKFYLYNLLD
jgi:hypothetical protein